MLVRLGASQSACRAGYIECIDGWHERAWPDALEHGPEQTGIATLDSNDFSAN